MSSSNNNERGDSLPTPIAKQNDNKEQSQSQNIAQEHNSQITKQGKPDENVTDFSRIAAAIEGLLKTFEFPTDTNRIIECVQFQSSSPDSDKILPILQKIEEKQYGNVSDVIKAAEKVAYK